MRAFVTSLASFVKKLVRQITLPRVASALLILCVEYIGSSSASTGTGPAPAPAPAPVPAPAPAPVKEDENCANMYDTNNGEGQCAEMLSGGYTCDVYFCVDGCFYPGDCTHIVTKIY